MDTRLEDLDLTELNQLGSKVVDRIHKAVDDLFAGTDRARSRATATLMVAVIEEIGAVRHHKIALTQIQLTAPHNGINR